MPRDAETLPAPEQKARIEHGALRPELLRESVNLLRIAAAIRMIRSSVEGLPQTPERISLVKAAEEFSLSSSEQNVVSHFEGILRPVLKGDYLDDGSTQTQVKVLVQIAVESRELAIPLINRWLEQIAGKKMQVATGTQVVPMINELADAARSALEFEGQRIRLFSRDRGTPSATIRVQESGTQKIIYSSVEFPKISASDH